MADIHPKHTFVDEYPHLVYDGENDATLNDASFTLPTASADTLGGVKVGEGLSISDSGVLSASGGGGGAGVFWVTITPNQAETGLIFDKTFGEVLAALNNGSYVVCKFDDGTILYMPLLWTMDGIPVDDYGMVGVFDSNSDTFQSTYTANSYESYPEYIYE